MAFTFFLFFYFIIIYANFNKVKYIYFSSKRCEEKKILYILFFIIKGTLT